MPRGAKAAALAATALVYALSWIHPLWPQEQALHDLGAVLGVAWLLVHERRWHMSTAAFIAICAFLMLHAVAAHWLYSNVPYDAWLRSLSGWSPHDAFGWRRNHFDRFVHLAYGLCFAPAIADYLSKRWRPSPAATALLVVMAVMCSSLVYEWVEWAIALGMAPDQAEAYNGQQGDMWDAHMDMLLATLGAAIAVMPSLLRSHRVVRHG